MKGFIKVHFRKDGSAVLIPVERIAAVYEENDGVFIETGLSRRGSCVGFCVMESFDEIVQKISEVKE